MFVLLWIGFCAGVGYLAKNGCGRGFWPYFFLSILVSPLIGFVVLVFWEVIGRD